MTSEIQKDENAFAISSDVSDASGYEHEVSSNELIKPELNDNLDTEDPATAERRPAGPMIHAVQTKAYLKAKFGVNTPVETFDLEFQCWCAGGYITAYGDDLQNSSPLHGYMGHDFSQKEIEEFIPTSSIRLISIDTLKTRPLWLEHVSDINNLLLALKGQNKLEILQLYNIGTKLGPADIFKEVPSYYNSTFPLRGNAYDSLERGCYYFILSQIEAIEEEFRQRKYAEIIAAPFKSKKVTDELKTNQYFDIVFEHFKRGQFQSLDQAAWINKIYLMGQADGIWGSVQDPLSLELEEKKKRSIKKYLGNLGFEDKLREYREVIFTTSDSNK